MRRRYAKYPPGAAGHDTEALQTDVMRFMAILGLCLTAIFALVRTLPLDGVEARGNAEMKPDTQSETEDLKKRVDQLSRQLESARTELMNVNRPLIDPRPGDRKNTPSPAGKGMSQVPEPVFESSPLPSPAPDKAPRSGNPDEDSKQGFSLRFESAYALERLIQKGAVVFFAMRDREAWRLATGGHGPGFVNTAFPRRFHEMSPDTVPDRYLVLFKRVAPAGTETPPVWGVHLPPDTEVQIRSLVNSGTGGVLVISEKGDVRRRGDG
jgi:hypothetical protein